MPGCYLTPEELVQRLDGAVTVGTLANWRVAGRGPSYTKIGRKIRYPLEAVKCWERQRTREIADETWKALS